MNYIKSLPVQFLEASALILSFLTTYCMSQNSERNSASTSKYPSSSCYLIPTPNPSASASTTEYPSSSCYLNPTPDPSSIPESPREDPVLSATAIANITCSGLAIIILTSVLCYTFLNFSKTEHRTRVRTALANNKIIDKQLAAAAIAKTEQRNQISTSPITEVGAGKNEIKQPVSSTSPEASTDQFPRPSTEVSMAAEQDMEGLEPSKAESTLVSTGELIDCSSTLIQPITQQHKLT